jgi:TolB-like protein/tetratricopeptide (TPR) repeat protein
LRYLFEDYALDPDRRELYRGANVVSLAPQVFDLLEYLIRNRGRVVSKDDLINAIWNGRSVSDAALTTRLNVARTAIGDTGEEQRLIKTLPRKGFRFVGQVREETGKGLAVPDRPEPDEPALALPDQPSIAVLPFENIGGDPEQEYFADGMVEEIITALSRFKWLFVVARNSSFAFKGKAVDVKDVGRRLGVRYVLEGSVRKAAGKVRITGQLIDSLTGAHIWADRFERDLTDVFALQDEVTVAVVSTIQPRLFETELATSVRRRSGNITAYDLYVQALRQSFTATREGMAEAIRLTRRALELDPEFARVASLAAGSHLMNDLLGYATDPLYDGREAVRLSRLALSLDSDDSDIWATAAAVSAVVVGDMESAIAMADRAVALNPNSQLAWSYRGWVCRVAGLWEEALRSFERAVRMNPMAPLLYAGMAVALIELRRFDEAVAAAERALRQNPFISPNAPAISGACAPLASALAHLGRDAEAREAAARLLEMEPGFAVAAFVARGERSKAKLLAEGLRKAGLPK